MLASMSVSWTKVGYSAGLLGAQILQGKKPSELPNYKPTAADHTPLISGKRLKAMGKTLLRGARRLQKCGGRLMFEARSLRKAFHAGTANERVALCRRIGLTLAPR